MAWPRVRLAARDCAGEFAAEFTFEDAPEAALDLALRDTVLLLSSARLRRSRIVICGLESLWYSREWRLVCVDFGPLRL
jgi:hypothetical protein